MNSLVKNLCKKCENNICKNYRGCAFRSLTNDYCEELENLNSYIKQLQQENQQLKDQLKQREEVIDEAIDDINLVIELIKQQPTNDDSWILGRLNSFKIILQKYKGDNNE